MLEFHCFSFASLYFKIESGDYFLKLVGNCLYTILWLTKSNLILSK
jgi:hypothetical protein